MSTRAPEGPKLRSPRPGPAPAPPRRIHSRELFGAAKELRIAHQGAEYRLTQTRHGKLLLTK
jgi:hemin uptake protein HemP